MEMIPVDPGQRYVIMCRVLRNFSRQEKAPANCSTAGRNGPKSLAMVLLN